MIERASIVGRVFSWKAVSLLSPEELEAEGDPQPAVAHAQGADPTGATRRPRTRRLPFRAHPGPGRGLQTRSPRRTRADHHERLRMDRGRREGAGRRVRGDRRLSPRAGERAAARARAGERADRPPRSAAATVLAPAGRRAFAPRGHARRGEAALPGGCAAARAGAGARRALDPSWRSRCSRRATSPGSRTSSSRRGRPRPHRGTRASRRTRSIIGLWIDISWNPEGWADEAEREATRAISAFEAARRPAGSGQGLGASGARVLSCARSSRPRRRPGRRRQRMRSRPVTGATSSRACRGFRSRSGPGRPGGRGAQALRGCPPASTGRQEGDGQRADRAGDASRRRWAGSTKRGR